LMTGRMISSVTVWFRIYGIPFGSMWCFSFFLGIMSASEGYGGDRNGPRRRGWLGRHYGAGYKNLPPPGVKRPSLVRYA
jgi:hypothetical protein